MGAEPIQWVTRRRSIAAALIAFCNFSKARTSICRTRSREMPYCCHRSSRVVGFSRNRRSVRMWRSRSFRCRHRLFEEVAAQAEFLSLSEAGLLALAFIDEPVLPFAFAIGPERRVQRVIGARQPAVHVDDVGFGNMELGGDFFRFSGERSPSSIACS